MRDFAVVVAVTDCWGMGSGNQLPWHPRRLLVDMAFVRQITTNGYLLGEIGNFFGVKLNSPGPNVMNAVIMGRKTWESIPAKFRPMPNRINIVISSQTLDLSDLKNTFLVPSFEEALSKAEYETPHGQTFVLGGSRVYGDALKKINCTQVFMTKISKSPNIGVCDVYFPRENVDDFGSVENITRSIYQLDPEKFIKGGALLDDENLRVDQTSDMISYQILHLYRKR